MGNVGVYKRKTGWIIVATCPSFTFNRLPNQQTFFSFPTLYPWPLGLQNTVFSFYPGWFKIDAITLEVLSGGVSKV